MHLGAMVVGTLIAISTYIDALLVVRLGDVPASAGNLGGGGVLSAFLCELAVLGGSMTSRTDPEALVLFEAIPEDLKAAGWRLSEQYSVGYLEDDTSQRSQYASYVRAGEGIEVYGESDGAHWQELRDELLERMRSQSNLQNSP